MKRIRTINGYSIYESRTARDEENYSCEIGNYNIYIATDIRDYGLTNSYPEYENIDSLTYAIVICNGSRYAVACALADELSDSTIQDMDLTLEIERRLDEGEAVETIRQCYDRETGRLYESISDAIAHGYDPYANDEFDPYEDHPSVGYDEDGRPHIVEDECEWDEDLCDGDLEDVFEAAMAEPSYEETELLCRAMIAAGYAFMGTDRYGELLRFTDTNLQNIYFPGWPEVREWLEGVVFDDPEVSDNVERILRHEVEPSLDVRVHARMTDDDYASPDAFEARLHEIAEELSLSAEDIDGFMSDYLLWYEGNPQVDPEFNRHEPVDPAEFVEDLFRNELLYNEPARITIDEAERNLQEYHEAGLDVPSGLTAELLREEWNDLCEKLHPAKQEHRSHASYAVLQDPDDGQYYTIAAPSTEGFDTQARRDDWLLCTVAKHHAFSDCGGYDVIEVVVDGRRVEYVGWQPGMLYEFVDCETGEIVWSAIFPEWDH